MSGLDRLLAPSSIAIAGLSGNPAKHGARVLAALRSLGYRGEVWGVNPSQPVIEGVDVYPTMGQLPEPPDLVVAAVPGHAAPALIAGCAGAGAVVLFAAGFAETGLEGKSRQDALETVAKSVGVRLLGPNSGGLIRPGLGVAASFLTCLDRPPGEIRSGPVGVVTQSGGTASYLHNLAASRGEGLAISISTGNEADLALGEAMEAVSHLDEVETVLAIIETVRDGPRFLAAVRAAQALGKKVVACRIGTTPTGRHLMESHTGALAIPDRVIGGVFDSLGVVAAETPAEAYDVAMILARTPVAPASTRVGVVTHSGGMAILLADLAGRAGLNLPPPGEALADAVREQLDHGSVGNPIDMGGIMGDPGRFAAVVELFAASDDYDVVLAASTAHPPAHTEPRARSLVELEPGAPVVNLWMAGDQGAGGLARLRSAAMAVTEDPRAAIRALAGLTQQPDSSPPPPITGSPAEWGIPPHYGLVASGSADAVAAAETLGYPVVVKLESGRPVHKTDIGGIAVDLADSPAVEGAALSILAAARAIGIEHAGLRVQRYRPGLEVIVGALRHETFGPLVSVGLGGVLAEVLEDVVFAIAPVSTATALDMIDRLRARRLLDGFRGAPPADVPSLAEIVSRVSRGVAGHSVDEFEINPLIWDGVEWLAVDMLAR